jgi:hypothetical protein
MSRCAQLNGILFSVLKTSLLASCSPSTLLDLPARCTTVPFAALLCTTPLNPYLVSLLVWSSSTMASSAFLESSLDPASGRARRGGTGRGGAPACSLQLRRRVCQKRMLTIDRANPTVHPLGGHVGPAAGDFYPLGVGREYRTHEAS